MRRTVFSLMTALTLAAVLVVSACAGPAIDPPAAPGYEYPLPGDFRAMTWTEAFKAAHDKYSREYAFGDWKGIDWAALYSAFQPRIAAAQAARDERAYYQALREYAYAIPDGHIRVPEDTLKVGDAFVGGSYGLTVAETADGRVMAIVAPGGPAAAAGMVSGCEITEWNGVAAKTALDRLPVTWAQFNPATDEGKRIAQWSVLGRGAVGSTARVTFKNPGQAAAGQASLTARADGGKDFNPGPFTWRPSQEQMEKSLDYRMLPGNIAYILLPAEVDLKKMEGYPAAVMDKFREAIQQAVAAKAAGLIVDIRGNYGGSDILAADISGFFYTGKTFYERQSYYDGRIGRYAMLNADDEGNPLAEDAIYITPQAPHYAGPVVAIVNYRTISSGEGVAMGIQRAPRGKVIGFHGTNGSFGMVGGGVVLPPGYVIGYPYGRSLDARGQVQLDSRNGKGGIQPDIRVPITDAVIRDLAAGKDVLLDNAVEYLKNAASK